MPMTEVALVGLACVLANSPNLSKDEALAKLSTEEKTYVQEIIDAKSCVSEEITALLKKTEAKNSAPSNGGSHGGGSSGKPVINQPCVATSADL